MNPKAPDKPVAALHNNPVSGDGFVKNNPKAPKEAAPMAMFIWSRPARLQGRTAQGAFNLPKATTTSRRDAPIHVAKYKKCSSRRRWTPAHPVRWTCLADGGGRGRAPN